MRISEILAGKDPGISTIDPDDELAEAARQLTAQKIGSLIVADSGGAIVGILTERDVVREFANQGGAAGALRVRDAMSVDIVSMSPDEDVENALKVMTENDIRHLPVFEDGALRGILSIGDVLTSLREVAERTRVMLADYISGKRYP